MAIRAETQVDLARVDDGYSPTATVTKTGDTATITITDKNGTTQEDVSDGSNGVSITSVKPQYYLSTSSSSATGGSWSDTPQAFVSGKYYWTRDYIDYSDGTHDTSTAVYNAGLTQANQEALEANAKADNVAQYFWFNSTDSGAGEGAGAHITEISQSDFVSDPANGGGNVLVRSDGINIRDGVTNLASFGATAILGSEGGARTEIGSSLISMVTEDDLMAFSVAPVDTVSAQQTVKKSMFDVIERGETKTFTYSFLSTAVASTKISVSCQFSTSSAGTGIGFTFTQGTAETKTSLSGISCTYNGSTGFTLTLPSNSAYTWGAIVSISYVIQTSKSTEVRIYGDLFLQDINLTSILSSPTLITTGISGYNTRADISSGGYLDVGKWRYVQMNVELNQELSANNYYAILQGFAIPSINTSMAAAVNSKNGGAVSAYINSSGNLIIETGTTKLYAQEHVTISGWYIKA